MGVQLEVEINEHLGLDKHQSAAGGNGRNGTWAEERAYRGARADRWPWDRASSFEPQIVKNQQRRLDRVDETALSATARGLTTGLVAAHFDDVWGASASRDTIRRITEEVVDEMAKRMKRPLDRV